MLNVHKNHTAYYGQGEGGRGGGMEGGGGLRGRLYTCCYTMQILASFARCEPIVLI